MRQKLVVWLVMTISWGVTPGCAPGYAAGLEALHEGRLPAAAAELRAFEPRFGRLGPRDQAHYALYRGLIELGLGNARSADAWLSFAKRQDARDAKCFDPIERGELLSAWRSTGRMAGEEN